MENRCSMKVLDGLSSREKLFLAVSFFFILYNAFPLLGDILPIEAQYVCIFTTVSLVVLFPLALAHKAIKCFFVFILLLFINGIMGRYIHINGLANNALPLTWRLFIEIAWILPALLIMSILKQKSNPRLYKIIGFGSVFIVTVSFLYILPIITSYSNILRSALHEENLDFNRPVGLPDYTLMHAYTFMLPGLCLYAKANEGIKKYIAILLTLLFYYIITQTAVSTSISLGGVVIIGSVLYDDKHLGSTIAKFVLLFVLCYIVYSTGLILDLIDSLLPVFDGTAVQFKLEDLHTSIVQGSLQGGSFEGREALHKISIDSFYANPLFGGGKAGGHSQMYDILGTVGIIGFIPFALVIWNTYKSYRELIQLRIVHIYLTLCFAVSFIYIYHKGIFGATGWLFMCVIAPCLVMAINYDILKNSNKII